MDSPAELHYAFLPDDPADSPEDGGTCMLAQLEKWLEPPVIDAEGDAVFWQDEYISKKLLETHLDPNDDLASRKPAFMGRSADWIRETMPPALYPRLLDFGCGPGLYTQRFAKAGYQVTGVDFSKRSIAYAREAAKKQDLSIDYMCEDYLKLEITGVYDLVTLIYCDYGALSAANRKLMMKKAYSSLKPGGRFLLDVCSVRLFETIEDNRTWVMEEGGFWSADNCLCLHANRKYPDWTMLYQTLAITRDKMTRYYIWNHCFTKETLADEAREAGFHVVQVFSDVAGQPFSEDSQTIAILLEK
jgi:SAM-dependent methyltransferase